jgi:hypothetical protein
MITAGPLALVGAAMFGLLLGWYLGYINRHRSGPIGLTDLATVIGAVGGGAVLALFPAQTDLFGAYGIGLAAGFFAYLVVLALLVWRSPNFDRDFFIDGRRAAVALDRVLPTGPDQGAMGQDAHSAPVLRG